MIQFRKKKLNSYDQLRNDCSDKRKKVKSSVMFRQLYLSELNHSMYESVSIYPFRRRTLRLLDCGFMCIYRKFSIMKLHTIYA